MAFRKIPKVFRSSRARRIGGEGYTRIARGWYVRTADLDRATSVYQRENLIIAARIAAFSASTPSPVIIRGQAAAFIQGLPLLKSLDDIEFSGDIAQGNRRPFGKGGMGVTWREGQIGDRRTVRHRGMRIASLEQIIRMPLSIRLARKRW